MLILVEVGCLAVGMVIAGVVYFLVPVLVVRFFGVCVGGFVSGYVYTSRSCAMLTKYKIIRETVV
jgi:hypothetical protein